MSEIELEHTGRSLSAEFDADFESRLAAYYCRDHRFLTQAHDLVAPAQFSNAATGVLVSIVGNYYRMYRAAPGAATLMELVKTALAKKTIREEMLPEIKTALRGILIEKLTDTQYMVDRVATFARSVAFDDALLKAAELKDKGDFEKALQLMQRVNALGATGGDDVYDYYDGVSDRYASREEEAKGEAPPTGITTGVRVLDSLLYHKGWGRREMTLFMGFAKSGKSTGMGEFSVNATLAGFNVLYLSLEVHTKILSDRFDARLSETEMEQLVEKRDDVLKTLKELGADGKLGHLYIVQRPPGTVCPNDIVRILESLIARGITIDMLVVDYADLMKPNYRSGDVREDGKNMYTDLRAVFDTYNVAGITATQTNREGGSSEVATMFHAADNIEKVRIADLIITINKTEEERMKGEARLFLAGSRNQKGEVSIRIKQNLDQMRFIEKVLDIL